VICVIPRSPGTKQTQLVSMAPLTTSRSGRMTKTSRATPTVCSVSVRNTMKNSLALGLVQDLKKQILIERISAPSSGTRYAIRRHHIQAIRSTSGSSAINCFSRPAEHIHRLLESVLAFVFHFIRFPAF